MISWAAIWQSTLGLPPGLPQWLIGLVALLCFYVIVILPCCWLMSFLERKLVADIQARVGPNRAGPAGFFQPFADFLKLLQKDVSSRDSRREIFWLAIQTMALYASVAVLPLGSLVLLVDMDMSAFVPFWVTLVLALVTMLIGLNQNTIPGWFGGMRVAALALAGALPALVSLLCAGVRAGGFRWSMLASSQGASPLHWAAFSSPFEFAALMVFVVSGMVIIGVPPLDGGYSQQDVRGGVMAHFHGRRLSLVGLGRFYSFFLWSVMAVVLFLGAWMVPSAALDRLKDLRMWRLIIFLELGVLLVKTFVLMLIISLIASVTPRIRADQVADLALKVLAPFSLVALAGTAVWVGWMSLT